MAAPSGKKKRLPNGTSESSRKSLQLTGEILYFLLISPSATDISVAVVGDLSLLNLASRLHVQLQLSIPNFSKTPHLFLFARVQLRLHMLSKAWKAIHISYSRSSVFDVEHSCVLGTS